MRSAIIITVKNRTGLFTSYDVEVPVNVPAGKLAGDIVEVLNYYKGGTAILPQKEYHLQNERTGKRLNPAETFLEGGVWQGDILIIE